MGKGGDGRTGVVSTRSPELATHEVGCKTYAWSQIEKHCSPDDAWIVHDGRVYDISSWCALKQLRACLLPTPLTAKERLSALSVCCVTRTDHPGGAVIFSHAGGDVTDVFASFHKGETRHLLHQFYVGDLDPESEKRRKGADQIAFEKAYRELRSKLLASGFFQASLAFYLWKCVSNMVLLAGAVALCMLDWLPAQIISAILLGLFWQQSGWLAHDFLHHQVFRQRWAGDLGGMLWGNVLQGYSMGWWKTKHNSHHAMPNVHGSSAEESAVHRSGDPDIDTMPLLAWSLHHANTFRLKCMRSRFYLTLIKWQSITYLPILLLARLSWLHESFRYAFSGPNEVSVDKLKYPFLEKLGLVVHWAWVLFLSSGFGRFSLVMSAAYFLIATCSCGFFLGIVFGLGHNGMSTYEFKKRPDFWKLQVTTTRNIVGGHGVSHSFVNWFCGGLQYQVEHHLFPSMPRHNLAKAHPIVDAFCKTWQVNYHQADLVYGTLEVIRHLASVADTFAMDFVREFPAM